MGRKVEVFEFLIPIVDFAPSPTSVISQVTPVLPAISLWLCKRGLHEILSLLTYANTRVLRHIVIVPSVFQTNYFSNVFCCFFNMAAQRLQRHGNDRLRRPALMYYCECSYFVMS